jgi:hypothetical protein
MKAYKIKKDWFMIAAGIVMLGSVWGLLECTLGSMKTDIAGFPVSMGAVMAGLFGIGFMLLARKMFKVTGVSLGVAMVAGFLRLLAPVGTCIICAAIAIMVEGLIFEIIVNRKVILRNIDGAKRDYRTLVFAGVITGFVMFTTGYVLTQVLTPLFTEGILISFSDLWSIKYLIIGRGFYAAILGGIAMPAATLLELVHLDITEIRKGAYYTASIAVSVLCWTAVVALV